MVCEKAFLFPSLLWAAPPGLGATLPPPQMLHAAGSATRRRGGGIWCPKVEALCLNLVGWRARQPCKNTPNHATQGRQAWQTGVMCPWGVAMCASRPQHELPRAHSVSCGRGWIPLVWRTVEGAGRMQGAVQRRVEKAGSPDAVPPPLVPTARGRAVPLPNTTGYVHRPPGTRELPKGP